MISGRFPSGLTFFCGFPYDSSRTRLAALFHAGSSVSSRDWVRLPADERSHRTLGYRSQRVATGFLGSFAPGFLDAGAPSRWDVTTVERFVQGRENRVWLA